MEAITDKSNDQYLQMYYAEAGQEVNVKLLWQNVEIIIEYMQEQLNDHEKAIQ